MNSKNNLKICLIVPWLNKKRDIVKNSSRGYEQLSIQYLAAYLKKHRIKANTLNAQLLEFDNDKIVKSVIDENYDLIGISCPAQRLYSTSKNLIQLLRKNGYDTEDYFFLLFYVPKEVMATGEVIFDTSLVKMKVDVKMAEKVWKKALELLNGDCPKKCCEWCEKV